MPSLPSEIRRVEIASVVNILAEVHRAKFKRAVRELIGSVLNYTSDLTQIWGTGSDVPPAERDVSIARGARAINDAIRLVRGLDDEAGGKLANRNLRRQLDALDTIIGGHLKRWNWPFVLDDDWEDRIKEKLARHEEAFRIPFLRCNLAWRSMPDVPDHPDADSLADEAEGAGLEPMEFPDGMSAQAVEAKAHELCQLWLDAPALGPACPTLVDGERERLEDAWGRMWLDNRESGRPAPYIGPILDRLRASERMSTDASTAEPRHKAPQPETASSPEPSAPSCPVGSPGESPHEAPVPEPDPPPSTEPASCPVVLRGVDKRPLVRGNEVSKLTPSRYFVIQALVEAWPDGLGKDELPRRSGCPAAVNMLRQLANGSPPWEGVILFPGNVGRGLGYRIAPE